MREGIRSAVLSAVTAWLVLFLYATVTFAENCPGTYTASLFAGRARFDGDLHYFDEDFRGGAIGYEIGKKLSAELSYSFLHTEENKVPGSDADATVSIMRAEALYHLPRLKSDLTIVPFLAAGAGTFVFKSSRSGSSTDPDPAFDYGLGVKWFFIPDLAIRGDVRHAIGFKNINDSYNVLLYYFGITYEKQAREKVAVEEKIPAPAEEIAPPPAPPVDSDKDGVPDDLDKCPDTPPGVAVDENGCPKDSDKDGVPDYLDKCPDTPLGTKVDANGCPPPEKAKMTKQGAYYFGNIYFDFDKSIVKPYSRPILDNVVEYMKKNPEVKMEIQGHTDIMGSEEYNIRLSNARANAVKKYIIAKGISADRLRTKGFGKTRPVAPNKTKSGRAKNRRIEFMPIQ
jgi:OmpA-OmpF porin, OOP family